MTMINYPRRSAAAAAAQAVLTLASRLDKAGIYCVAGHWYEASKNWGRWSCWILPPAPRSRTSGDLLFTRVVAQPGSASANG